LSGKGDKASHGQFPYHAVIELEPLHEYAQFCGGAILNERTILTAASSLVGLEKITVRVGIINSEDTRESGYNLFNGQKVNIHPNYTKPEKDYATYDIATIILDEKIKMSENIQPLKLQRKMETYPEGQSFIMTGLSNAHYGPSKDLCNATFIVSKLSECAVDNTETEKYRLHEGIHICALNQEVRNDEYSTFNGGSALVSQDTDQSYTAYGIEFFKWQKYYVADRCSFTRIDAVYDWIQENMEI